MAADPTHSTDSIFYAFVGLDTVLEAEAVVSTDTDQPTLGEVFGLRLELAKVANRPAAAKKENNGWTFIRWLPVGRILNI